MNTESTGQTPWYSRKGLFLLVGAIILIVSVFGYRTTQLRLDMADETFELHECSQVVSGKIGTNSLYVNKGDKERCQQFQENREDYVNYNSLSIAGLALGLILMGYGVILHRRSG